MKTQKQLYANVHICSGYKQKVRHFINWKTGCSRSSVYLISGVSDTRQARDDCFPTKQLLHDVHSGLLHWWIHVDQLVGDSQLMHHWLESKRKIQIHFLDTNIFWKKKMSLSWTLLLCEVFMQYLDVWVPTRFVSLFLGFISVHSVVWPRLSLTQ